MNSLPTTLVPARVTGRLLAGAREVRDRVVTAFESPWVAYGLLLALQLKVIWGMWAVRDITTGDTSGYYMNAWRWFAQGSTNIAWSPLYCAFYGMLLHINSDPVWATVAHRIIIVLASGVLALAVFRRLMPPAAAWLCGAWWAVLPIAFNTLYEVHLFAVLPVLAVWLLMATARGPARRAAGLGLLGASVVLVRNELSVPFALMAAVLAVWEWRAARHSDRGRRAARVRAAGWYAASLLAAAAACGATYQLSIVKYPALAEVMRYKHTLNMAQVYAYGYQQRHPEWTFSPWTDCEPLAAQTFGTGQPSLGRMIAANPRAAWEHFAWNMSLAPNGLQILLFNGSSGRGNPDYTPDADTPLGRTAPLYLSIAVGAVWALGLVVLWRRRREWRGELGSARSLAWLTVLIVISVTPLVITTQRPRPSYLFALGVAVMAATGALLWLVVNRWGLGERLRQAMPVAMIGLVVAAPSYYKVLAKSEDTPPPPRFVAMALERLKPHQAEVARPGRVLLAGRVDVSHYLNPTGPIMPDTLYQVLAAWTTAETLPAALARAGVDYLYLDEEAYYVLRKTGRSNYDLGFMGTFAPAGWERIDGDSTLGRRWQLFRRAANAGPDLPPLPPPAAIKQFPDDLGHPSLVFSGIDEDGWVRGAFSATLTRPAGACEAVVRGEIPTIPGAAEYRTEVTVLIDGIEVARRELKPGAFEVRFPAGTDTGARALACRFSDTIRLPAPDTRTVAAYLKFFGFEPKK